MAFIDALLRLSNWRRIPVLLLLGLMGVLGHAPFHIWPVTIFMFALCYRAILLTETTKQAFRTGLWIGLGYFMGNVYWIGSAFIARGPEFIPAMPPMILGLAITLAFFWAVAAWIFKRFRNDTRYPYLILAALLFLAEIVRGYVLGGFPWNLPGYIFKAGGAMSQSASLFGIYGLSLLVLMAGALLARILWAGKRMSVGLLVVMLAANTVFGFWRLSQADIQYADDVRLRIVQVPFAQKDKMDDANPAKAIEIIREFLRVSAEPGLEDITHLIWPEGASDGVAIEDMGLRVAVGQTLLSADNTPPVWLMNSLRIEENPDNAYGFDFFNTSAALVFDDKIEGEVVAFNDKRRLVPFGEFIPGGKTVEDFGAKVISSSLGSITPAPKKVLAQFPGLSLGSPQICYEVLFSGLTPRHQNGARPQWILNQSNDAWYGASSGPYQHANIAQYRAIEEKIPVIRSTSNGFTGVIDPYGRFTKVAGPKARKAIDARLPLPIGESLPFRRIYGLMTLIMTAFVLIPLPRR